MIPNFQFSLSSALPVITRADLRPALEEDSISLVFSRLPVGDEDSLQSAVAHGISFLGSKGKFQGANMRPSIMQTSQRLTRELQ